MQFRHGSDHMILRLAAVFIVLALGMGLAVYWYFDTQKNHLIKNIEDELSAIADLKVDQIAAWRKERLEDAMSIVKNPLIAAAARQAIENPGPSGPERDLLYWMKSLQQIARYQSVILVDPRGNVRLSASPKDKTIGPQGAQCIQKALRSGQAFLSDFHKVSSANSPHLDLVAPLILLQRNKEVRVGAIFIRIDPGDFLYPLIQSWSGSSKTAETLLIRKDGDSILFLNELRHQKNTAFTLRLPLSTKNLPATRAIQGETGVREGIDYRGVPVLAVARPVPRTHWFLVSKVDTGEIYTPIREQARFLFINISLLIVALGLGILLWWRRKSAEHLRSLHESELQRTSLSRQYEYVSKYANDIILLIDPNGIILEANDLAVASYGYSREELLRLTIRDLRSPETLGQIDMQMRQVREQKGFLFETTHKRKNGTTFPVEVSSRIIDVGDNIYFQSIIRNITERKQAEAALKQRNAFIEAILDNLPIGLAVNTIEDGKTVYLNHKFEEIYGQPKTVLVDVEQFFIQVYPDPVYRKEIQDRILSDIASKDPSRMRWDNIRITMPTGESKFVTAVNIPLFDQNLMISTVFDVTALKQAEHSLIESKQRYKRLIESVTDYIYTVEVEHGRPVRTVHGPGCMTVTGYTPEEFQADPGLWLRILFEGDRNVVLERMNAVCSGAIPAPFEHRIIHKNGSLCWVRNTLVPRYDEAGRLIACDGSITDITQLTLLENQLRQAQKMEAVGQLSGGIAHDFNNILTAIIGYGHLLLMKMEASDPLRAHVDQILLSSERAAHLTRSLLAFSRKQVMDLRPVNLNSIVTRVEKLLARIIGEDIEFRTILSDGNLTILADSVQIEQVLMNLATNARDALQNGGLLRIESNPIELGEDFVRAHSYGKPGRYACLSVTDTGVGMDEETRTRIFEPFFTTKEIGKGTGLGLSIVYGIIKQHNGYINVYSEPGKGTTFTIYFPLIITSTDTIDSPEVVAIHRGTETVLLAEDDDPVRNLTRKVLENFGYRVIEALDGEEAVQKFMENKEQVDLLILDVVMPKMNGKEAYQEMLKVRPGIKVLFTSGYTADIVHKRGILETGQDFIMKPTTPSILLTKVREVLNKR